MMSVIRSGLDAAIQNLDVTSNNIANTRTTGYKKQQATFTDMYSTKIATATGDRLGIGVQMPEIEASQKQGSLQITDSVMDLAIEGEGLLPYVMQQTLTPTFIHATVLFTLNKEGNVVSRDIYNLMSTNNEPINIPLKANGIRTADGFNRLEKRRV